MLPSFAVIFDIGNEVDLSDAASKYLFGDTLKLVADIEITTNHTFIEAIVFNGNGYKLEQIESSLATEIAFTFLGSSVLLQNLSLENFVNGAVSFESTPVIESVIILQNCIFSSDKICKSNMISVQGDSEFYNTDLTPQDLVINNVKTNASLVSVSGALQSITIFNSDFVSNELVGTDSDSWLFNVESWVEKIQVNQVKFSENSGVSPQGSTDSELLVFNRGGDLVYENENYNWTDENNRFQGFYRDTDNFLPSGTYFCTIFLDKKYGKVESKGFLVIKY